MYAARRVTRPTRRTSSPVANGSSVPRCPMRRSPRVRRTRAIASWEVIPRALSRSRMPSIGRLLVWERSIPDLTQEGLDAGRLGDGVIEPEFDLGGESESQRTADARAQVSGDVIESI